MTKAQLFNKVYPFQIKMKAPDPTKPDPQRQAMEKLFLDVAGVDGEVDWMELKLVLDHCFRDDIAIAAKGVSRSYHVAPVESKKSLTPQGEVVCCGLLAMLQDWYVNMAGGDNRPERSTSGDFVVAKERAPLMTGEMSRMYLVTNPLTYIRIRQEFKFEFEFKFKLEFELALELELEFDFELISQSILSRFPRIY